MIQIKRKRRDETGKTIKPDDSWFKSAKTETKKSIKEGKDHKANKAIYSHDSLRRALEKLFHYKCAYCECSITRIDWDVEHFRPKGRVAENKDHPGYYWLTYDWNNLYPSCTFCNQKRKDKPLWGDLTKGITGGKADQFPLIDEKNRAMSHRESIKKEKHLLLSPCNDIPSKYLTFGTEGQIISFDDNKRGNATISIFNLFQRRLKKERKKVVKNTRELLRLIKKAKSRGDREVANDLYNMMKQFLLDRKSVV